jgi:hypothetical protein
VSDENAPHDAPEPPPPRNEAIVQAITIVSIVVTVIVGVCAVVALTKNSPNQMTLVTAVFGFAGLAFNQILSVRRAVRSDQQIHQDVKVVKHQTNGEMDKKIKESVAAAVAAALAGQKPPPEP